MSSLGLNPALLDLLLRRNQNPAPMDIPGATVPNIAPLLGQIHPGEASGPANPQHPTRDKILQILPLILAGVAGGIFGGKAGAGAGLNRATEVSMALQRFREAQKQVQAENELRRQTIEAGLTRELIRGQGASERQERQIEATAEQGNLNRKAAGQRLDKQIMAEASRAEAGYKAAAERQQKQLEEQAKQRELDRKAADDRLKTQLDANAKLARERNETTMNSAKIRGASATRPSAAETTAYSFWNRANQAHGDANALEDWIKTLGVIGQQRLAYAPNILQSENGQLYRQAQRVFTEARLRKESGAAISAGEYENDAKMYFAQPGDTDEVINRKRQAREEVLKGLQISAGRAYTESHQPESGATAKYRYNPQTGKVEPIKE